MNLLLTHEEPTPTELMTGCAFAGIAMDKWNKTKKCTFTSSFNENYKNRVKRKKTPRNQKLAAARRLFPPMEEILDSLLHALWFVHHGHGFVLQRSVSHAVVNVFILLEHPELHLRLHPHRL